ncbi:MAG: hypothetical protein WCK58_18655 [Chloroflexota bacterium]
MSEPDEPGRPATPRKRRQPLGQSIGGVLFGFEQQVWRNQPPPHELVRHARPDSPVPAGDGTMITIGLPDDAPADPFTAGDQPLPEPSPSPSPSPSSRDHPGG